MTQAKLIAEDKMMMKLTWAFALALGLVWTTGCKQEQAAPAPEPRAPVVTEAEAVEAVAEVAAEAEEAAEAAEEAAAGLLDEAAADLEEAVEAAEEVAEEVAEQVEETAQAAVAAVQAAAAQAVETAELAGGFASIDSSAMKGVMYDADSQTLSIQFPTGDIYDYSGVSAEVFEGLMESTSKGRYYVEEIKDAFDGMKR